MPSYDDFLAKSVDSFTKAVDKLDDILTKLKSMSGAAGSIAASSPTGAGGPPAPPGQAPQTPTGQAGKTRPTPSPSGTVPPPYQAPPDPHQRLKQVMSGVLGLGGLIAGVGARNMGPQIALNSLQYQSSLMSTGGGSYTQFQRASAAAAYGTFGTAGTPSAVNVWATSPMDMAQTFGIISGQSGYAPQAIVNANPGQTRGQLGIGVQLFGQTRALSYLNPGLSGTGAAQIASQLYSPQASLSARMVGLPAFRTMGKPGAQGQGQDITRLFAALGASASTKGQWNPHWLQAQLAPGGIINQELAGGYGLNQNQVSSFGNELEVYNRLFQGSNNQRPLNSEEAQQLISDSTSRDENVRRKAQHVLQQYGVPMNDADRLKMVAGSKAAQEGDTSRGYTAGLDAATSALEEFRKAMQKTINTLHLNLAQGFTQGYGGTLKSQGNFGAATSAGTHVRNTFKGATGGMVTKVIGKVATNVVPGGAIGGNQVSSMLSFMTAQEGHPYLEQNPQRFGPKFFDCSGLVYTAAHKAGIPLPQSDALANLEADWFAHRKGAQVIRSQGSVQRGDLVFFNGAAPRGSSFGPIGHVGMATSGSTFVSAYDTALGVKNLPIGQGGGWRVGVRLTNANLGSGNGSSTGTGGSGGTGSVNVLSPTTMLTSSGTRGSFGGASLTPGDTTGEGSTSELAAFQASIAGGLQVGSGYFASQSVSSGVIPTTQSFSIGGGGSSSGGGTSGNVGPVGAGLSGMLKGILHGIGAPTTSQNMAAMTNWTAVKEGFRYPGGPNHGGKFNPLNTTQHEPGSTTYNSAGVQNYRNPAEGVKANVQTLLNGRYHAIIASFRHGWSNSFPGVSGELSVWSGGGYSSLYRGGHAGAGTMAIIGERGPELVHFGKDSSVLAGMQDRMYERMVRPPQADLCLHVSPLAPSISCVPKVKLNMHPSAIMITHAAPEALPGSKLHVRELMSKRRRHEAIARGENS